VRSLVARSLLQPPVHEHRTLSVTAGWPPRLLLILLPRAIRYTKMPRNWGTITKMFRNALNYLTTIEFKYLNSAHIHQAALS
jgi:hypothetical protein